MMARRSSWAWGGASQTGGRLEQQDRWGVFTTPRGSDGLLAIVADGLGGHGDGALGAQAVVEAGKVFFQEYRAQLWEQPNEALALLCNHLQTSVVAMSRQAHSTVVALWLKENHAHWMHVGDSRLYHLRSGCRLVRTRDHSAAQMLLELGEIDEGEVADHPAQSCLYRSLGSEQTPRPDVGAGQVEADDMFVLCSDGVWEHIREHELWDAAVATDKLSKAAAHLTRLATARGGPEADNATLVIVRPTQRTPRTGWWRLGRFSSR